MAIDPSIVLGIQQYDPSRGIKLEAMRGQLQEQQQAQQGMMALRQLMSDPSNIDPQTGMPNRNALARMMAVDPNTGMKLVQNVTAMQGEQAKLADAKLRRQATLQDLIEPHRVAAMSAYEDALKAGQPVEAARMAGQRVFNEARTEIEQGGVLSEAEKNGANWQFDPQRVGMMSRQWQAMKDKQRTDARLEAQQKETERHNRAVEAKPSAAGSSTLYFDDKNPSENGAPTPFLFNPKAPPGQAFTTVDGKPYVPRSATKPGTEAKPPVPGSIAANRAAIADDVNNDPDFKDKPPGVKAQEIETRLKIAQGTLDTPEARKQLAEQIASYQVQPLSGFALSRPAGQQVMAEVAKINPEYQSARYGEVNSAMKEFGPGKKGDVIRSLNVATQHIGTMEEAAEALKNGETQIFNRIGNRLAAETGSPPPTTFDALKQIVGTEIEKAVAGGIGAVADRDRLMKSLDGANSPEQLRSVFASFKALMAGQAAGLRKQYEDATGFKSGRFSFDNKLLPETMKQLGMLADKETPKPEPAKAATPEKGVPLKAVEYLKAHPEAAAAFDQKYGEGAAKRALERK